MAFVITKQTAFTFKIGENGPVHEIPVFRELNAEDVTEVAKMDVNTPLEEQQRKTKEYILKFAPEAEKEINDLKLGGMAYVQIFEAYLTFQADAGK